MYLNLLMYLNQFTNIPIILMSFLEDIFHVFFRIFFLFFWLACYILDVCSNRVSNQFCWKTMFLWYQWPADTNLWPYNYLWPYLYLASVLVLATLHLLENSCRSVLYLWPPGGKTQKFYLLICEPFVKSFLNLCHVNCGVACELRVKICPAEPQEV